VKGTATPKKSSRERWTIFSHRMICHGRLFCFARQTERRPSVRLADVCPKLGVTNDPVRSKSPKHVGKAIQDEPYDPKTSSETLPLGA